MHACLEIAFTHQLLIKENRRLLKRVRLLYMDRWIGLARTIYIRCIYGVFGREITRYTVIYGVYIRFWHTLYMEDGGAICCSR
jgi:hypothetical protein